MIVRTFKSGNIGTLENEINEYLKFLNYKKIKINYSTVYDQENCQISYSAILLIEK